MESVKSVWLRRIPVTLILLAVSLALNVLLAKKLHTTRRARSEQSRPWNLQVGYVVPHIEAKDLDGRAVRLGYENSKPTLLYIFHPECSWCESNIANVRALAAELADRYRFLGLSRTEANPRGYAESRGFAFPVYFAPSADFAAGLELRGTPQTVVLDARGRVLRSWVGAYMGGLENEIEGFFGVKLPGATTVDGFSPSREPAATAATR